VPKVGLLWRQEWDPPRPDSSGWTSYRLRGVFEAFAARGVHAESVIYGDDRVDEVRERLLRLDGVLVWVNPIEKGLDRSKLDPVLCEVARDGVWVSAHPDVITRMATKRVLYDTRELSWGTDTRLYHSAAELRNGLAGRLDDGVARVLKQQRGMGGRGVWKIELAEAGSDPIVRVQHGTSTSCTARTRAVARRFTCSARSTRAPRSLSPSTQCRASPTPRSRRLRQAVKEVRLRQEVGRPRSATHGRPVYRARTR
jgi:hypothetical protein